MERAQEILAQIKEMFIYIIEALKGIFEGLKTEDAE